ncbi:hypothetical protein ARMSODRAFT_975136 [Armillaria solidipes]|uniref:Uncharacterized protein n=1 Tax=Armillaria solidipes TaxID=1076256 RepID=A0A2H3BEV4_9AGAR|nr:hypothetical protein ARMSODRAFT_975136 [Armillaria solidipes]
MNGKETVCPTSYTRHRLDQAEESIPLIASCATLRHISTPIPTESDMTEIDGVSVLAWADSPRDCSNFPVPPPEARPIGRTKTAESHALLRTPIGPLEAVPNPTYPMDVSSEPNVTPLSGPCLPLSLGAKEELEYLSAPHPTSIPPHDIDAITGIAPEQFSHSLLRTHYSYHPGQPPLCDPLKWCQHQQLPMGSLDGRCRAFWLGAGVTTTELQSILAQSGAGNTGYIVRFCFRQDIDGSNDVQKGETNSDILIYTMSKRKNGKR